MTLDEAIKHCEEVAKSKTKQVENGDWEKGSSTERACIECANEHLQLANWLKELKAYRDARAEINQALNDDARGEQNDYERGRKSGIFLCESIISVKIGESRSENPNKWIPVSERLPEERGVYLVTQKAIFPGHVFRRIVSYAPNLHDVNEYDFEGKKRAGWYKYDSEWGYWELEDVIAWMPLPEPYKAESEDKE